MLHTDVFLALTIHSMSLGCASRLHVVLKVFTGHFLILTLRLAQIWLKDGFFQLCCFALLT